jgi:hypothetical protein
MKFRSALTIGVLAGGLSMAPALPAAQAATTPAHHVHITLVNGVVTINDELGASTTIILKNNSITATYPLAIVGVPCTYYGLTGIGYMATCAQTTSFAWAFNMNDGTDSVTTDTNNTVTINGTSGAKTFLAKLQTRGATLNGGSWGDNLQVARSTTVAALTLPASVINGGLGNDYIKTVGNSTIDAGSGADQIYAYNARVDTINCGSSPTDSMAPDGFQDLVSFDRASDHLINCGNDAQYPA